MPTESAEQKLTRVAETRARQLLAETRAQRGINMNTVGALILQYEWTRPMLDTQSVKQMLANTAYVTPYTRPSSPEFVDLSLLANVADTTDKHAV